MNKALDTVLARVGTARKVKTGYLALCPAHDDHRPSLSITPKPDGVLLHCFAGCAPEDIARAMGISMAELFDCPEPERPAPEPEPGVIARYTYHGPDGRTAFQVVRYEPKSFRQRRPDGKGGWIWNLDGVETFPYRLRGLLRAAHSGGRVFVVEGEKDVHSLLALGLIATTNPGGAGNWRDAYSRFFAGADVVIIPDNDPPGIRHAQEVERSLAGHAKSVRVLPLPGLPEKGDVSDWLAMGHTKAELLDLAERAAAREDAPPEGPDARGPQRPEPRPEQNAGSAARPLYTLEQLLCGETEEVKWAVEGLAPEGGITVLGGDSGVGKSWVAYHLALCAASGCALFGKFAVSRTGVLVFDAESALPLCRRRVRKLFTGLLVQGNSLECGLPMRVYLGPLRLRDARAADRLAGYLSREGIGLVIADPLIHCLPDGANENDSVSMAKFFELVRRVQAGSGASFVFCHHSRKRSNANPSDAGQMLRGSSAIRGVLDSHIFLRRIRPGVLLAEHDKSRHAEAAPNFTIQITDPDADSTVVAWAGPAQDCLEQAAAASSFVVRAVTDAGGRLTRKALLEQAKSEGLKERTVCNALRLAVDSGVLIRLRQGNGVLYCVSPAGSQTE